MRLVFLCKRRYMGKDVSVDRYARLYEIPVSLPTWATKCSGSA